jgi:hypothetical protein
MLHPKRLKKGYVYIFIFSLISPILGILKYPRTNGPVTLSYFLIRTGIGFVIFFVPLLFLAKWYYKQKDKS